ncbi:hypothetical protein SLS62_008419 [Diatrype stigma]|uniref:Cytochrome P450 monooxygenase n=1 Tax=Diatrype stigma TaxID=117547 RepID=A0AAN9YNR1_9PEZI
MEFYLVSRNGTASMLMSDHENHRRVRQLFSPAFSDRALKKQEALFQKYTDRLVATIDKVAAEGKQPMDMVLMYNLATFDMMGDFTFGQSLGMLENVEYNPWLKTVFDYVKLWPFAQVVQYSPILNTLAALLEPKSIAAMRDSHFKYTADRVNKRLETGSDRPDLWNLVQSAEEEGGRGLSHNEMHSNAELLMVAGSETTATLMSGLTYFLALNPAKMQELTREIRSSFTTEDEITMESVASLRYLNACIQEALRIYPPAPIGTPRAVPAGGRIIAGQWVAPGTRVSVHHYTTYRYPANFANPDAFVPERWLGDPAYENDRRKALQPFSYGPRSCLGQNMAMHEMRVILAKVFFSFDLELSEESFGWAEQKVFALWEKGPLMCYRYVEDDSRTTSPSGKAPEPDNLSDLLGSLSLSTTTSPQEPTPANSKVVVRREGHAVPLQSTLEIKTRVAHRTLPFPEVAPQLWVSQTPKLVRAYHRGGRFEQPQVLDVTADIRRWEQDNQTHLQQLAALVKKILDGAKECGGNSTIKYDGATDRLVITKVGGKAKRLLPEDLYAKWDGGDSSEATPEKASPTYKPQDSDPKA